MSNPGTTEKGAATCDQSFLPDFCNIRVVFAMVIVAELLAFVLVVGSWHGPGYRWDELGIVSLFVQWVALSSAALLCLLRGWLCRFGDTLAGLLSYLVILLVTLVASEAAFRLGQSLAMQLPDGWRMDFLLRNLGVSAVVAALGLRLLYLQHQQRSHLQVQAQARIEALQARIRPHFLFNSMNTISALIRSDPRRAEEAIEDLSDLFRSSLADGTRLVSLADELETARRYLEIEALRLGERLRIDWQLDAVPMEAQLPPLTLQPLLENAIYHGIERLPGGGTVQVIGSREGGEVRLVIENPVPSDDQPQRGAGHRMAFDNIRERLTFAFGKAGRLVLAKGAGRCRVELRFPFAEAKP